MALRRAFRAVLLSVALPLQSAAVPYNLGSCFATHHSHQKPIHSSNILGRQKIHLHDVLSHVRMVCSAIQNNNT